MVTLDNVLGIVGLSCASRTVSHLSKVDDEEEDDGSGAQGEQRAGNVEGRSEALEDVVEGANGRQHAVGDRQTDVLLPGTDQTEQLKENAKDRADDDAHSGYGLEGMKKTKIMMIILR